MPPPPDAADAPADRPNTDKEVDLGCPVQPPIRPPAVLAPAQIVPLDDAVDARPSLDQAGDGDDPPPVACLVSAGTLACNQTLLAHTGRRALAAAGTYRCPPRDPSQPRGEVFDRQVGFEDAYDLPVSDQGDDVTARTNFTVRLSGLSQDLNLFLITDEADRCGDINCRSRSAEPGTGDEVLRFTEHVPSYQRRPLKVVVDGPQAGDASYQLELSCSASCAPVPFDCLGVMGGGTQSAPSRTEAWGSCLDGLTGPERVYDLGLLAPGRYTADLYELGADLDLVVMKSSVNAFQCDPTTECVASSSNPFRRGESATFEADGTSSYLVVVDGRAGAAGSYRLALRDEAGLPVRRCPCSR